MKSISQPRWKEPEYTRKQINEAGIIVRDSSIQGIKREEALKVLDNWRSAHAYPMHVFYINLRRNAPKKEGVYVVERLKRLDSIVAKLEREKDMQLYRMQDLGGCRMILPTVEDVYLYADKLKSSRIRHELLNKKDYIQEPKYSGYRSYHQIYRFHTDTLSKQIFNDYCMRIEIQFRTHLQHLWATAVEMVGLFTGQALKAGQGEDKFKRFFVLVASLFALEENCPVVPGTVNDKKLLIEEINEINSTNNVLDILQIVTIVVRAGNEKQQDKNSFYILQLNYEKKELTAYSFMPSEAEEANMMYDKLENEKANSKIDVVLVRASSFSALKIAYPNYFLDIKEFVSKVYSFLNEKKNKNI